MAEGDHRVDLRSPARRANGGNHRDQRDECRYSGQHDRIARARANEQVLDHSPGGERTSHAQGRAMAA